MKSEKPAIGNRIIYLLIGLAGIFLMYSTVITTTRTIWLRSCGRETTGIVTKLNEEWQNITIQDEVKVDRKVITPERQESRLHDRALVSVETEEGTAEINSSRLAVTPAYAVGSKVKVLYFPGKLDEGQIKDEIVSTWTNIFTGLVGLLMFVATIGRRLVRKLFLMDEPESALSLQRQLTLLALKCTLVRSGQSQFIAATHSPILMTYPGAAIVSFDHGQLTQIKLEDSTHFQITRELINNPTMYWRHLASPDDGSGRFRAARRDGN